MIDKKFKWAVTFKISFPPEDEEMNVTHYYTSRQKMREGIKNTKSILRTAAKNYKPYKLHHGTGGKSFLFVETKA